MVAVTVIIPCFNAEAFLLDAVRSVQAQRQGDFECLIVDDGSRDGTRALIERLAQEDSRIRPIILPSNQGVSVARNVALDAARGDWVALLDADDLWKPERLGRLIELARAEKADFVADNITIATFPGGRPIRPSMAPHLLSGTVWDLDRFMFHCARRGFYDAPTVLKPIIRRRFLVDNQLRYDARYRSSEDFLLYFMALFLGARFITTNSAFYITRERSGSITRSGSWSHEEGVRVCDDLVLSLDGRLPDRIRARLLQRKRKLLRTLTLRKAFFHISHGDFGAGAALLWRNPSALSSVPLVLLKRLFQATFPLVPFKR